MLVHGVSFPSGGSSEPVDRIRIALSERLGWNTRVGVQALVCKSDATTCWFFAAVAVP